MTDPVIYISAEIPADAVVRSAEKDDSHLIGNAKTSGRKCGLSDFAVIRCIGRELWTKNREKNKYGRKVSLNFIENGLIFPDNAEGYCILCAGNGEERESKREQQNCGWLLIGKRQKRMKNVLQHMAGLVNGSRPIRSLHTSEIGDSDSL